MTAEIISYIVMLPAMIKRC